MRSLVLLLLAAAASAQPTPGEPAPDPGVETYLNATAATSWDDLRGQAVVMDLWATWCAPCVATLPHLAALADSFAGRPVRFLSVSDEPAEAVARFLEGRRVAGWVGVDPDGSSRERYGVGGIPQVVLVYPDGRLAAVTHPDRVDGAVVEALLAGRPLGLPDGAVRVSITDLVAEMRRRRPAVAGGPPSVSVGWAAPDAPRRGLSYDWREGWATASDADLASVLASVWGERLARAGSSGPVSPSALRDRMDGPDSLLARAVDVDLFQPGRSRDAFADLVFQVLQDSLGLSVSFETRPTPGFALRRRPGRPLTLAPDDGDTRQSSSRGVLSLRAVRAAGLAQALGAWTRREVADETGLDGTYRLLLEVEASDDPEVWVERVRAALRARSGLELVPVVRPAEWMVVRAR